MGFVIPAGLFLSALAVPIIIFYMLKLRRLPAPVSSVLLWQKVIRDREANAPWQRLRRNLLLLLQLLTLALMVMAFARPFLNVEAKVQGNVVILLDASASMQSTDVGASRYEAARNAAWDVISTLRPTDMVTIINVEHIPHVLISATGDRAAIKKTLDEASAGYAIADWKSALALAASGAAANPDTSIVAISDGAIPPDLPTMPVPTKFIQVGQGRENIGITALSVRTGREGPQVFMAARNFGEGEASALAEILLDGELFAAREIAIQPGREETLSLEELPPDIKVVEAHLDTKDNFHADDRAWTVYATGKTAGILLVTEGNLFLERALSLLPSIKTVKANPNQPLPETDFDLTIFDRALPEEDPTILTPQGKSNVFVIAPPRSTGLFEVNGILTNTVITKADAESPLLAYVDVDSLHVAQAQKIEQPPWARSIIEARGGPLLIEGETGGRRVAVLAFEVNKSDWPLQIGFPIFIANLTNRMTSSGEFSPLITSGASGVIHPGDSVPLKPPPEADSLVITTPSGRKYELPVGDAVPAFGNTGEPGLYAVSARIKNEYKDTGFFAVNLLDEEESDITPGRGIITGSGIEGDEQELTGRREFWWPLAMAAFVVLIVEWWVYKRSDL